VKKRERERERGSSTTSSVEHKVA